MTYRELFKLKFQEGIPTYELLRRYPSSAHLVTRVALCDVPEDTLKEILSEEDEFLALMRLKKKFLNKP